MYHFFVSGEQIKDNKAVITGPDVNHIANVLRMKTGEQLEILDGNDHKYLGEISGFQKDSVTVDLLKTYEVDTELPVKIVLFQGFPKSDKMEQIIQKCVELGVSEIVPVMTSRTIVKLDDKKSGKKVERFNAVSLSAAKQSGRGIIPEVKDIMSWKQALEYANNLDKLIIPYEDAEDMNKTREIFNSIKDGSLGIFIGPEGGFSDSEVKDAINIGAVPVTLGKRILRTETAGMAVLAMLGYVLE